MERLLARLLAAEGLLKWILNQLRAVKDWNRWAEQRIRELGGQSGSIATGGGNSTDPNDIANAIHCTGCVTTAITKATTSGTPGTSTWTIRPGTGNIQRFTAFDSSGPTLNNLTGVDEPIYSTWKDNGVATGCNVQAVKKQGAWWLIDFDSCANLTP